MNKKDREEIRGLQGQWMFVVFAAFLALFLGLAVNALYSLLKEIYSDWYIFIGAGLLALFFGDAMTYFFDNLHHIRENADEKFTDFLKQYFVSRIRIIRRMFRRSDLSKSNRPETSA